jgi:hypothetical protein
MKLKSIFLTTILGFLIATGISSCANHGIFGPPVPNVLEEHQLPHKVAILPFVNATTNPEAATIVRKMFYNFFSSLNYRDLEAALIDSELKRKALYKKVIAGENVSPQRLGQFLGTDAVIYGEVLSLGKIYALVYSDNQASLRARMVNCTTGKIIWELEHTIHLREGDVPLSLTGLATALVKTAVSYKAATHMKAASELCMQMVATIPNPVEITEPPPKIRALLHNGSGKMLRPGDFLKVVMIGDQNQAASLSISPLVDRFAMKEKEPGVYIGAYRVKPGDRLSHGRLVGYLKSKTGLESQWADILGPISIGTPTLLPAVISQDTELKAGKSPYLAEDALLVLPGVKFIVGPGTVIWFRSLGLIVQGELQILGTPENPVRLAGMGPSPWKGILLDHSQAGNRLQHCKISDAEFAFRASKSTVSIQDSLFQDNVWGIILEEGQAKIENCLVRTSKKTGISARKSTLSVTGSTITENEQGGFLLEESQARIQENNITNNGAWHIKVVDNLSDVKAAKNWWGEINPADVKILGPVEIKPVLKKPVNIQLLEF